METIYKIKVVTNPDPRWLFPSERRYSASIVLGLGVVHLALASTAFLMACLTLTANEIINNEFPLDNNTNSSVQDVLGMIYLDQGTIIGNITDVQEQNLETLSVENNNSSFSNDSNGFRYVTSLTLAPCMMCIGSLAAGLTGLLAWKRWYIDHNIKWFFLMSLLSTITSTVCLVVMTIIVIITNESLYSMLIPNSTFANSRPNNKFVLSVNILIASLLEWLWSILSTKIAFVGMKNKYPDDIMVSNSRGKVEVSTVHKGNKMGKMVPPDILNHFSVNSKIAKYLPKKISSNLPKDESNSEYQERVNRFLASNTDANSAA